MISYCLSFFVLALLLTLSYTTGTGKTNLPKPRPVKGELKPTNAISTQNRGFLAALTFWLSVFAPLNDPSIASGSDSSSSSSDKNCPALDGLTFYKDNNCLNQIVGVVSTEDHGHNEIFNYGNSNSFARSCNAAENMHPPCWITDEVRSLKITQEFWVGGRIIVCNNHDDCSLDDYTTIRLNNQVGILGHCVSTFEATYESYYVSVTNARIDGLNGKVKVEVCASKHVPEQAIEELNLSELRKLMRAIQERIRKQLQVGEEPSLEDYQKLEKIQEMIKKKEKYALTLAALR